MSSIAIPEADALGRMNMVRLKEIYVSLGMDVRIFASPGEALAWLERCEG